MLLWRTIVVVTYLLLSANYGDTTATGTSASTVWTEDYTVGTPMYWRGVTMSSDGSKCAATEDTGKATDTGARTHIPTERKETR